jgi:succinoglycan biosynthesis transport protein ExoP
MEQFKQTFDLILYDMPPLLGLADAKLIASKTDGIAMVVGLGKTKSSALAQALESIKLFQVTILGIIANGSKDYVMPLPESYHRYYPSEPIEPALERQPASLGVQPLDD